MRDDETLELRDITNRGWDGLDRVLAPLVILLIIAAVIAFAWASQQ